jgi:hypothetical protein
VRGREAERQAVRVDAEYKHRNHSHDIVEHCYYGLEGAA